MAITHIHDESAFDSAIAAGDVLVDFWAAWCGPCRMLAPELETLSDRYPALTIVKIDVDELPALANRYRINAIPALKFFSEGKMQAELMGYMKADQLAQKLNLK